MFLQAGEKTSYNGHCLVIHPIIVVSILREFSFYLKIHCQSPGIPYRPHFGITNGGKGIGCYRKPGHAERCV